MRLSTVKRPPEKTRQITEPDNHKRVIFNYRKLSIEMLATNCNRASNKNPGRIIQVFAYDILVSNLKMYCHPPF